MFGELDDLETLFWLSYLGPGVEEESGDLDVSVHRGLHERGVHLVRLVLLCGETGETGLDSGSLNFIRSRVDCLTKPESNRCWSCWMI